MKKSALLLLTIILSISIFTGCAGGDSAPAPAPAPSPAPSPAPTPEDKVTGTITYREKIALPAGAIVEIKLLDISKQGAPAVAIGEQVITTTGQQVPFSFEIKYNPATIDSRYTYAVRATITVDGKLRFTSDTTYPVITRGNPSTVEMVLKSVATPSPPPPTPAPTPPEGDSAPSGTAAEIADKIFTQAGVESFGMSQSLEKDEDKEFLLGSKDYPEFADSVAITPMISIDTRVLYVIEAANKGDVEVIKTKLDENIDPNKLICVTFTLEDVVIESRGNVIFMTINSKPEQRTALTEAFITIE
ncbi:YbaY family lipoprotein [Chloroflexota bacterium]